MKNNRFAHCLSDEIRSITKIKSVLLCGGLISVAFGVVICIMFCGSESAWHGCLIPRAFPPRIILLIFNFVWNFILGAAVAYIVCYRHYARDTRKKCIIDVCIGIIFFNLWYPLLFSASAPFLAFVSLAAAVMFLILAVLFTVRYHFLLSAALILGTLRIVYYAFCTVSYMVVNCVFI